MAEAVHAGLRGVFTTQLVAAVRAGAWAWAGAVMLLLVSVAWAASDEDDSVWAVLPDQREGAGSARWVLAHFPPRTERRPDRPSGMRFVLPLEKEPAAIGWRAGCVVMAFGPERRPDGVWQHRMLMVEGTPLGDVGAWSYGTDRAVTVLPPIEVRGDIAGLVVTRHGTAALVKAHEGNGGSGWKLMMRSGGAWAGLPLPWEREGAQIEPPGAGVGVQIHRLGGALGVVVIDRVAGVARVWTRTQQKVISESADGSETGQWREGVPGGVVRLPVVDGGWGERAERSWILPVGSELMGVWDDGAGHLRFAAMSASGVHELNRLSASGADAKIGVRAASRTVVVLIPNDELPGGWRLVELSGLTGRVVHDGAARRESPVPIGEVRFITFAFSVLMLVVMLVVFRTDQAEASLARLPKGVLLAGVFQRMAAQVLDFVPGLVVAAAVYGLTMGELFDPVRLVLGGPGASGLEPVLVASGVTMLHATLGEWLVGRSIGKAVLRCRVISILGVPSGGDGEGVASPKMPGGDDREDGDERASGGVKLWQACVRNVVKFGLPPLGLLMLFHPIRQHAGDMLGRTVVVSDAVVVGLEG